MTTPIVSVYMTVKNGSKWVREAINSVRRQTLEGWELIVVDDGSTDSTLKTLLELQAIDPRIKVIPTKGIGRGAALNLAVSNCRCDWLANLDGDDLSHPRRLEIQKQLSEKYPDFCLIASEALILEGSESPEWVPMKTDFHIVKDVGAKLAFSNPINHSSIFVQRKAVETAGGYNEELRSQFDYELWVRMTSKGFRLGKTPSVLIAKRWHSDQSFESRKHILYVLNSLRIQAKAIKILRCGVKAWIFLIGRIIWALLPREVRLFFRR